MAFRLSLNSLRFGQVNLCSKYCLRASLSTTTSTPDHETSPHRSVSRFSVKIARFLFSKNQLQQATPLSTHAHYTKSESSGDIHELARDFILSLEPEHRRILSNELMQLEKQSAKTLDTAPVLTSQLAVVFLETGLPYIGFGFVDNFVMLVAGETIEAFFGVAFCLSTMAAAALGNAVSDVMGIGLADRIERTCGRFLGAFGIQAPKLTSEQWSQRSVHITQLTSKVVCIFIGCLLGMCPLLFRDTSKPKEKSTHDSQD